MFSRRTLLKALVCLVAAPRIIYRAVATARGSRTRTSSIGHGCQYSSVAGWEGSLRNNMLEVGECFGDRDFDTPYTVVSTGLPEYDPKTPGGEAE